MGSFSIAHWLIVLVVVLLVFGPSKLGQLGKGMGEGIKNFKKGLADDEGTTSPKQLASSEPVTTTAERADATTTR